VKRKSKKKIIFITGGARSGKSTYAQQLAADMSEKVLFVATSEARDSEMKKRIANHRRQRPKSWQTLECPLEIAAGIGAVKDRDLILIDCITLLVSNIMGSSRNMAAAEKKAVQELEALIKLMQKSEYDFVIVSNEVGLGIVPENVMARQYRDLLGKANQMLAASATEVYFMAAGIPLKLK
jgi:adenosylcobinamide kinase / adenosylcobinamide-phosphate guanylyltransferase